MSGNRTSTHNPTKKILVECVVLYFLWIFRWSLFARRWKKFLCLLFFLVVSNLLIPPPPTTNCYREFLTFFNLRKQFNNIFFPSKKKKIHSATLYIPFETIDIYKSISINYINIVGDNLLIWKNFFYKLYDNYKLGIITTSTTRRKNFFFLSLSTKIIYSHSTN